MGFEPSNLVWGTDFLPTRLTMPTNTKDNQDLIAENDLRPMNKGLQKRHEQLKASQCLETLSSSN